MRRIIALTSGALLWAATLSSMATTPSVSIGTSFTLITPGQEAAVFPGSAWTNSGTFTATPADSPTNHGEWVVLEPDFSWTISPFNSSYLTFNPTNAATVVLSLLNSNAWGYVYTITNIATWSESNIVTHTVQPILPLTNGAATNSMLLDAIMLDSLQYWWDPLWEPIRDIIYVLKGSAVKFKAIPSPSNASWPSGTPVWGGTAGASGAGETKDVTFSDKSSSLTDYKTVTVQCGKTQTVNVVVYEIEGLLTPQDNFEGRSTDRYGVGENIDLTFTSTPAVTVAQIGGLKWKRTSGIADYTLDTDNYGTGTFGANDESGNITLKLEVLGGPSAGFGPSYSKEVIKPTGVHFERLPGYSIFHINGEASIGFLAELYLLPKDVSFNNIEVSEGECESQVEGYFEDKEQPHHQGQPMPAGPGNITNGCKLDAVDKVQTPFAGTNAPPYIDGIFMWEIPYYFQIEDNPVPFTTVEQIFTIDDTGKMSAEKEDVSVEAELDDPTQTFDEE